MKTGTFKPEDISFCLHLSDIWDNAVAFFFLKFVSTKSCGILAWRSIGPSTL